MAVQTRAIRSKIKSVGNIKKITKAMELVAASKMKKTVSRALSGREYAERMTELLAALSLEQPEASPLLMMGAGERTLMIVVESNKGLCGSFNVVNAKAVIAASRAEAGKIDFIAVGRNAERLIHRLGGNLLASFVGLPEDMTEDDLYPLASLAIAEFHTGNYRRVLFAYNSFISALSYKATIKELLPVSTATAGAVVAEIAAETHSAPVQLASLENYTFEPSIAEILQSVLPRLVEVILYQGMLESRASEESARMLAMKTASDNAEDLIDELTLSYNNARQAGITQEIAEIAAGANALAV